jgi:hypothetical protein
LTESVTQSQEAVRAAASRIDDVRAVELRGNIDAALGLSGAVVVGDYLVIGADEGHKLQVLERTPKGHAWRLKADVALARDKQEIDIEAITYGDGYLYVVGSHSYRRRRMKPDLSVRKNRERLLTVESQASRNRLYRVAFDAGGGRIGSMDRIDLSKRLAKDPLLHPFVGLPSKENGIDIEGIAYRDGLLHLGFRGPVLRDNFVPVMVFPFKHPKRYSLRFVRLGGQGIRDFVALDDGFLIVSGPVNDGPGPYQLWWWDGQCQIPGRERETRDTCLLGEISTPGGAKAEGLSLLGRDGDLAEVLLVYETSTTAQAVRMRVHLPG